MKQIIMPGLLLLQFSLIAQDMPFNAFYYASSLVVDSKGNVFVSGKNNNIIKITPDGKATSFAGSIRGGTGHKDGLGPAAMFNETNGLAIDASDNIYVADATWIRKVTPDGFVTSIAGNGRYEVKDGIGLFAAFYNAEYIAIDKDGNIYVTDERRINTGKGRTTQNIIRKINPAGAVTTLSHGGKEIQYDNIRGLACDDSGNLYFSLLTSRCIKKLGSDGSLTTVAGLCDKREYNPVYKVGDLKTAELVTPNYLTLDKKGTLYFSDGRMNRVIKIENGKVATVAGNSKIHDRNIGGGSYEGYKDGNAKQALFYSPAGIAFDSQGNLFIVDSGNRCIRKMSPDGKVTTFSAYNPAREYYDSGEGW